jgi:hypothetical protein
VMEELVKKKKDSKAAFGLPGHTFRLLCQFHESVIHFNPSTSQAHLLSGTIYSTRTAWTTRRVSKCHLASPIVRQWPLALHWSCCCVWAGRRALIPHKFLGGGPSVLCCLSRMLLGGRHRQVFLKVREVLAQ